MGGCMANLEWEGILHWKTWALAALDSCISTTKYALLYWTPLIIYDILGARNARAANVKNSAGGNEDAEDVSEVAVALLTAAPFAVAAFATIFNAWLSKRNHERRMHVVIPLCISAGGMAVMALVMGRHAGLSFICLMLAMLAWAPGGILSAYPSSFLSGPAAASGWAVVNAVGALLGGLAGPFLVGSLKTGRGDYTLAVFVLAAIMAVGAVFAFFILPIVSADVPHPKATKTAGNGISSSTSEGLQLTDIRGAC